MKSLKRHVWLFVIGLLILLAVVSYSGVVCYFYVFDSNNIYSKLKVWSFLSNDSISSMYLDASFEIEVEDSEVHTYGINVDEDGYVVTVLSSLGQYDDSKILVYGNNSSIYNGSVVFADETYNLAVLRLSPRKQDDKIALPYVRIGSYDDVSIWTPFISVGMPGKTYNHQATKVEKSDLVNDAYYIEIDGQHVLNKVFENVYTYTLKNENSAGAILNKHGELIGLDVKLDFENPGETRKSNVYTGITAELINTVLSNIKSSEGAYKNELVENLDAIDITPQLTTTIEKTVAGSQHVYNGHIIEDSLINIYQKLRGVYLFDDFTYNGVTLSKSNIITRIVAGDQVISTSSLYDVIYFFYTTKSNDTFTVVSYNIENYDIEVGNAEIVSTVFTVI